MGDVDATLSGHAYMADAMGAAETAYIMALLQVGGSAHVLDNLGALSDAVYFHAIQRNKGVCDTLSSAPDAHTGAQGPRVVGEGLIPATVLHRETQVVVYPLVGNDLSTHLADHLSHPLQQRVAMLRLDAQSQDEVLLLGLARDGHTSGVRSSMRQGTQHLDQVIADGCRPSARPTLMQYPADSTHGKSTFRRECKAGRPKGRGQQVEDKGCGRILASYIECCVAP